MDRGRAEGDLRIENVSFEIEKIRLWGVIIGVLKRWCRARGEQPVSRVNVAKREPAYPSVAIKSTAPATPKEAFDGSK